MCRFNMILFYLKTPKNEKNCQKLRLFSYSLRDDLIFGENKSKSAQWISQNRSRMFNYLHENNFMLFLDLWYESKKIILHTNIFFEINA